ncbi:twin-arginine translocase subunit TatC [Victivallis sp. Marseille-Q1083]|uniref:twin-arginine translocase subunit TatC n=1 Tax=Victivallis sp. Marseille-Q1083 TaxID=2717288 RepID=UPI00158F4105|nr:twin-arginine translocase subunit TatC [Victivallis sp. Marseille-Q1083]
MPDAPEQSFISHLEALRNALLHCVAAAALLYPVGYWLTSYCIDALIRWSCPPELGALSFFSPMEVFIARLKLALILALALGYPYCAWQIWRFLLPALYEKERRALKWGIVFSSVLFLAGVAFCAGVILPMVMRFAAGFATPELKPVLGLSNFLNLAGWLMLAFGLMFQFPLFVLLLVKFGVVQASTLRRQRPYIIVLILILAAVLTPPDVISQLLLAIPTWLLFELGLLLAGRRQTAAEPEIPDKPAADAGDGDGNMADFYRREARRKSTPPET